MWLNASKDESQTVNDRIRMEILKSSLVTLKNYLVTNEPWMLVTQRCITCAIYHGRTYIPRLHDPIPHDDKNDNLKISVSTTARPSNKWFILQSSTIELRFTFVLCLYSNFLLSSNFCLFFFRPAYYLSITGRPDVANITSCFPNEKPHSGAGLVGSTFV